MIKLNNFIISLQNKNLTFSSDVSYTNDKFIYLISLCCIAKFINGSFESRD